MPTRAPLAILATAAIAIMPPGAAGSAPPIVPDRTPNQWSVIDSGETLERESSDSEGQDARPPVARRVVAQFDFEERATNPDPVPQLWYRAQSNPAENILRPGFPPWNTAGFEDGIAYSGSTSVKLPTRGGSTALRLKTGAIPVFPRGEYVVSAMVRTERLRSARAFLTAVLLDAERRPIEHSRVRSRPMSTEGIWQPITIDVQADGTAAFLQIDLELLQPDHFAPPPALGENAIQVEDIDAAAWFDDVTVYLVPQTELTALAPGHVAIGPDRPQLRYAVRDLVGEDLRVRLEIADASGQIVATHAAAADPSGREIDHVPDLPGYGPYTAVLRVVRGEEPVGAAFARFVWLPPPDARAVPGGPGAEDRRRFGLIADHVREGAPGWPEFLPELIRRMETGFVVLAVPPIGLDETPGEEDAPPPPPPPGWRMGPILDELLQDRQHVTLSLTHAPLKAAEELGIDPRDAFSLIAGGEAAWLPRFANFLDRYGQRVTRWQLGVTGSVFHPGDARANELAALFRTALARFVPGPLVSLAWDATTPPDAHAGSQSGSANAVTVIYPPTEPASNVVTTLHRWSTMPTPAVGSDAGELTMAFAPPAGSADDATVAGELVKRATELWAVAADTPPGEAPVRLAILDPWSWTQDNKTPLPSPQLVAWRNLIDRLAGRQAVAEFSVAPGVRCIVFANKPSRSAAGPERRDAAGSRGVIIAWNAGAQPEDAVLDAYLGDAPPTLVDLFGNSRPLVSSVENGANTYRIPIPSTPIFIENIDPHLAQFIASFRIDPFLAHAVVAEHEHALVLANPWPVHISGQLQIVEPRSDRDGWSISPRGVIPFSIPPGTEQRIPLRFSFGPAEEAGIRKFVALVQVTADRPYPPLRLTAPIQIGLPDLHLSSEVLVLGGEDGSGDVVVIATVRNSGKRPRILRLDCVAPGSPAQQQPISNLAPGESAVQRFVFKGRAKDLSGKRVRLLLSDIDTPERLNKSAVVP